MGVIVLNRFILTFCQRWIHLYLLPADPSQDDSGTMPTNDSVTPPLDLDPAAGYKWQWRIDSLVVSHQSHGPLLTRETPHHAHLDAINIFIRFDTWYPWPVNILHHFVLPPNPAYDPSKFSQLALHHPLPSPGDLPYLFSSTTTIFGPYMANSIASPMRLFTPSDMVLGEYGTALWIDAQTDMNSPSQAGDHGQRIAGKMLSKPNPHYVKPDSSSTLGIEEINPGFVDFQPGAHLGGGDGVGTGAGSNHDEQGDRDSPIMVFEVRDSYDGWNRLALDEEEGRIAVGSVDGTITVFDYAPLQDFSGQASPNTTA